MNKRHNFISTLPINRWIELEENPDTTYQIKEVYPLKGTVFATIYGEDFLYDMATNSAVVLAQEPTPKGG